MGDAGMLCPALPFGIKNVFSEFGALPWLEKTADPRSHPFPDTGAHRGLKTLPLATARESHIVLAEASPELH